LNEIIAMVSNWLGVQLDVDSKFGDPEKWDSLGHLLMVTELEVKFNIFFSDDEISKMVTMKKLIEVVEKKVGRKFEN